MFQDYVEIGDIETSLKFNEITKLYTLLAF